MSSILVFSLLYSPLSFQIQAAAQGGLLTHHDTVNGFTLSYPASWNKEDNVYGTHGVQFSPDLATRDNVLIDVVQQPGATLDSWTQEKIGSINSRPGASILQLNPTTLGGNPAYKVEYMWEGDKILEIWTVIGDKLYAISYVAEGEEKFQRYLNDVNNMIESFQIGANGLSTLSNEPSSPTRHSSNITSSVGNQTTAPWLGISMANVVKVDPLYAQKLGLNESTGVMLTEVKPGSPAEKAGLLPPKLSTYLTNQTVKVLDSDVILEIDNLTVHDVEDISSIIQTKEMGDSLTLTVLRSGQTKQVIVTPTPKPDFLLFKDPGLLYTILYPSNWTAVQPERLQELAQQSERLQELTRPETVQQVAASFVRPDSPEYFHYNVPF